MARLTLDLPPRFDFCTRMRIRIQDVNYAGHLGNDALLGLLHEARVRFFKHLGFSELDVDGLGLVIADALIIFKAQAFHGDPVEIAMSAVDFNRYGCDLVYRLRLSAGGVELARAKTGIVFFDYGRQTVAPLPPLFQEVCAKAGDAAHEPALF